MSREREVLIPLIKETGWNSGRNYATLAMMSFGRRFDSPATPLAPRLSVVDELRGYEEAIMLYFVEHPSPPSWEQDPKTGEWFYHAPSLASAFYSSACMSLDELQKQETEGEVEALRGIKMEAAKASLLDLAEKALTYKGRPQAELDRISELFQAYARLNPNENTGDEKRVVEMDEIIRVAVG